MGKIVNPFGNDSTPKAQNESAPPEPASLPPRGTGLETGNAGERRKGNPRTDEERAIRHGIKLPKGLIETEGKDGYVHVHQEGTEPPIISNTKPKKTIKEQWADYHANKIKK